MISSKEKDLQCQRLIVEHSRWNAKVTGFHQHSPPCQFGSLENIYKLGTFDNTEHLSFLQLVAYIDVLLFQRHGECATCGKWCKIFDEVDPDLDVSGLPCIDSSPVGTKLFEEGKSRSAFICHAKLNCEKGVMVILIENVSDPS